MSMFHKLPTLLMALIALVFVLVAMPLLAGEKTREVICKEVSIMIKDGTIKKHIPESIDISPHDSEYRNLDIDGDGKADKVTISSGSEGSFLEVGLSCGGEYNLDENGFIIVLKIKDQIYALVTYWEWKRQQDTSREGKIVNHSLYMLTKQGTAVVCKNIY